MVRRPGPTSPHQGTEGSTWPPVCSNRPLFSEGSGPVAEGSGLSEGQVAWKVLAAGAGV